MDQGTGQDEESEVNMVIQIGMVVLTSMDPHHDEIEIVETPQGEIIGMIETAMTVGDTGIKIKNMDETGALEVVILVTGRTATVTEVHNATETRTVTETVSPVLTLTERATQVPETADLDQETDHAILEHVTIAQQLLGKPRRKGAP